MTPNERRRLDLFLEFAEAIDQLGGTILPAQVHDEDIKVDVPERHKARAGQLLRQLSDDLVKLRDS